MAKNLFKFAKLSKNMPKIMKIAETIEVDGFKMKLGCPFQQSGLSTNASQGKKYKKFGLTNGHKGQIKIATSSKNGYQG